MYVQEAEFKPSCSSFMTPPRRDPATTWPPGWFSVR